jgi:NADH-quinone oxidoreductase subunit L
MRKMGGLAIYMPITYLTFMIGALALSAIPPFAGYYSKDLIIEAVKLSTIHGAGYAYICVLAGVFITPLYTFRALFMTFHTNERMDIEVKKHIHESPWVVLIPLIGLAIPSFIAGGLLIKPFIFAHPSLLGNTVFVLPNHAVLTQLSTEFHGANPMWLSAGKSITFWLALSGIVTAWLFAAMRPQWATYLKQRCAWLYYILRHQYGFNELNQKVLVQGTLDAGHLCYDVSDVKMIDGVLVNGSGRLIRWFAQVGRYLQTGYIYHYALAMLLGLIAFLTWYIGRF